jgi:hypothetical protein
MLYLALISGVGFVVLILLDAFETVVLPRRVQRHFRFTAWFYRATWRPWRRLSAYIPSSSRRESFLGYFGPLSLIVLLVVWAFGLILGFTLVQYGLGSQVRMGNEPVGFITLLYMSGETFFTLGFGDVTPTMGIARAAAVLEAGMGFAFLGIVIGYLPVIYTRFSEREIEISLLDARAGSPPTAAEFLRRMAGCHDQELFDQVLRDWERWAAQLLESHLSYAVLAFFRSQHGNQSWLGALTTVLDSSALVLAGIGELDHHQAKLAFAMARHCVVDLSQVLRASYPTGFPDRLPEAQLQLLREQLQALHLPLREGAEERLKQLRQQYEPYAQALAARLAITLPPWIDAQVKKDNWQSGPWDRLIQAQGLARRPQTPYDHF